MDILNRLYSLAEEDGIQVLHLSLKTTRAMSLLDKGHCYIGMDDKQCESIAEQKVVLSHELGHCETGSFYNQYSPFDIRERHELRADRWAIEKIVSRHYFKSAVNAGVTEPWELAELFNVPQPFIEKAMAYYHMLDTIDAKKHSSDQP